MSFYDYIPDNPNIEQIKDALISVIVTAQQNAMPHFKQRIKNTYTLENGHLSDDATERLFVSHTSDIAYAVEDVFKDDATILERVHKVFDDPDLAGLDSERLENGFYYMGYIYAMYWYGITGTAPDPSICVGLNHLHADEIEKALCEADGEISKLAGQSKSAPKKSSRWLYWILMLIIGIAIGAIIKSCS